MIEDLPSTQAIEVGRLFLKPKSVNEIIMRVCRTLLLEAKDTSLQLGRAGSATLVRYKNKNFILITRHQLGLDSGQSPPRDILETLRITSSQKNYLGTIPIQECIFEISNSEEEFHDILVFEVATNWQNQSMDAPFFYPIEPFSNLDRHLSFLIGCPMSAEVMRDYTDAHICGDVGEIHLETVLFNCELDQGFKSNAAYYKRYTTSADLPTMDGYSGGAVFSLVGNMNNWKMMLDGIVLRGGNKFIHIIDSNYLSKILECTMSN
ncbi:MAG: hypothetical protein JKX93_15535 [Rhizobiaceae bacterium]|nr:hypothetical protein [Rhizobiaceae bacterium]